MKMEDFVDVLNVKFSIARESLQTSNIPEDVIKKELIYKLAQRLVLRDDIKMTKFYKKDIGLYIFSINIPIFKNLDKLKKIIEVGEKWKIYLN